MTGVTIDLRSIEDSGFGLQASGRKGIPPTGSDPAEKAGHKQKYKEYKRSQTGKTIPDLSSPRMRGSTL